MTDLLAPVRRAARMPLIGGSAAVMAATVVTSALGFLFWNVATRHAQAHAVGTATALLSLASTAALLTSQGAQPAVMVRLPACSERAARTLTIAVTLLSAAVAAAACAVVVAALPSFTTALPVLRNPMVAALIVLTAAAQAASGVIDSACVALRKARGMSTRNAAFAAVKLALLLLALTATGSSSDTTVAIVVLGSWGVSSLLTVTAATTWLFRGQHRSSGGEKLTTEILTELRTLHGLGRHHLAAIAGQLPAMMLPLLVAIRVGAAQAAYFNVAWMVGGVCFLVSPAVAAALLADGGHEPEQLRRRSRLACAVILGMLAVPVIAFLFAGDRILNVFGPEYGPAGKWLLIALALSSIPDAITNITVSVWRVGHRLTAVALLNGGMTIGAITCTWMLLPLIGIPAAGWAWLLVQTAGCAAIGADLVHARQLASPRLNPDQGAYR